jgi:DMSO/TMAO reductase YedYZ molybdopterin-dependent catalytic subunit
LKAFMIDHVKMPSGGWKYNADDLRLSAAPQTLGMGRRHVLRVAGLAGLALVAPAARAGTTMQFSPPLPGGPNQRTLTTTYPTKGPMILQRSRPPLLETPFEVFDRGVLTPNDQFFVRWHWANIPKQVDADAFRLALRGHVNQPVSLSLPEILAMPRVDVVAVNQCSGNSRGYFQPRIPGGEWGNGAMGNARWTGVRLKDLLDRAGVKAGAVQVRFNGLDEPVVPNAPDFMKSLDIEHARDGEVIVAFGMNGDPLPFLNGFPLRLVVPGWHSTYWVKMLSDIEVLDKPDDNFWMAKAYLIPDTPGASVRPGETGYRQVPISRMVPRSFVTNLRPGDTVTVGAPALLRGVAFGGDTSIARVELSFDSGETWQPARLGRDEGKYSFRQWQTEFTAAARGTQTVMVRCTNTNGVMQPGVPVWNPAGFMQNVIESISLTAI